MNLIWLFVVSIIPGIFWVWFFYRQDYLDPEPWGLVAKSFIGGALAVIPVSLIETPFAGRIQNARSLFELLVLNIVIIGVTEEVFKFLGAYFSVYRQKDFNEVMDGIIYVVTAGLGFAAVENLVYTTAFGYKVGAIRAVITSLAHAGFSGVVGFNFGMARCNPERRIFYIIYGLLWGSILHGLYDFIVVSKLINFYMTIIIVLGLQIYLARLIKHSEDLSPFNK